jgi:hypothetical protein
LLLRTRRRHEKGTSVVSPANEPNLTGRSADNSSTSPNPLLPSTQSALISA